LSKRGELEPERNGGVSFLLIPFADRHYDFWVYICPWSAGFSSKTAVHSLRKAVDNNVAPWGTLEMDDRPLIDQLYEATTSVPEHLAKSEMMSMLSQIGITNMVQQAKMKMAFTGQGTSFYAEN
jgi:hypothetical protein